jgi:hypothetical protein
MVCSECNKPLRIDNKSGYCALHRAPIKKITDRIYYIKNKQKISATNKKYKIKNRDKVKEIQRAYIAKNKEKVNAYKQKWLQNNPEKRKLVVKKYSQANKKKTQTRKANRRALNINYKLTEVLRTRLYFALKNNSKSGSAVKDLGCTVPELKLYLESKFQPGMTWDNWAVRGWHIDHIKPLSSFDLTNRKEFLKACHYTNLQPLWWYDNIKKGFKILEEVI